MSGPKLTGPNTVYAASRINADQRRRRRTKAELQAIYDAILAIVAADHPMTVRGVFYRLVVEYLVGKTENECENVGRYVLKLRRDGVLPYAWIADNTRWMRKPRTYGSLADALNYTAATYRRSLWEDQDAYVEVWIEKDTLAGVVMEETEPWDVPLLVCRGFSSETYLYNAAEVIRHYDRPTHIYLLTDHDPSGLSIAQHVERRLREFLPTTELGVERVAVTEAQIETWNLPTRPTKKSDSRSKNFTGSSVELDAIPAATLRALVRSCIERHVDQDVLRRTYAAEELERHSLYGLIDSGWLGLTTEGFAS